MKVPEGPGVYWGEVFSCVYPGGVEEVMECFKILEAHKKTIQYFIFYFLPQWKEKLCLRGSDWEYIGLNSQAK